jgi:hypothetical protein
MGMERIDFYLVLAQSHLTGVCRLFGKRCCIPVVGTDLILSASAQKSVGLPGVFANLFVTTNVLDHEKSILAVFGFERTISL